MEFLKDIASTVFVLSREVAAVCTKALHRGASLYLPRRSLSSWVQNQKRLSIDLRNLWYGLPLRMIFKTLRLEPAIISRFSLRPVALNEGDRWHFSAWVSIWLSKIKTYGLIQSYLFTRVLGFCKCVCFQRSNFLDCCVALLAVVAADASSHNCARTLGNGGNTTVNEAMVNHTQYHRRKTSFSASMRWSFFRNFRWITAVVLAGFLLLLARQIPTGCDLTAKVREKM